MGEASFPSAVVIGIDRCLECPGIGGLSTHEASTMGLEEEGEYLSILSANNKCTLSLSLCIVSMSYHVSYPSSHHTHKPLPTTN